MRAGNRLRDAASYFVGAALLLPCSALRAQEPAEASAEPAEEPAAAAESADEPATQPADAPAPEPHSKPTYQPTDKGIQWTAGDYTWKVGGYFKVDLIHDFDEIGSTDSFDPRTIPTVGADEPGDATRIHARQTRFNLDVRGPTTAGDFHGFFEGDFFSDQNSFRMRHAYGSVGSILGGQTWSTFMDEEAMPETLDYESPVAFPQIRQAMIRWTRPIGDDGNYWAIALEDPESDVLEGAGAVGESEEPLPDVTARFHFKNARGHTQLGLFTGMAAYDSATGDRDEELLWGLNLSGKIGTWGSDSAIVQATYGDGVARYRGGNTAVVDATGEVDVVRVVGLLGSYQHYWSETYRSSIGYGWSAGDVPTAAPIDTTEEIEYAFLNLIWQFCDRAWTGIEFLHGARQTVDDEDGSASRIQFSLRYDV